MATNKKQSNSPQLEQLRREQEAASPPQDEIAKAIKKVFDEPSGALGRVVSCTLVGAPGPTRAVLSLVVCGTPRAMCNPSWRDPNAASFWLPLKYEGTKGYAWEGRSPAGGGPVVEVVARIKEDDVVVLEVVMPNDGVAGKASLCADLRIQVGSQNWLLPGDLTVPKAEGNQAK